MGAPKDIATDVKDKSLQELRDERAEEFVKSMLCFRCRLGRWTTSDPILRNDAPQCVIDLKSHEMLFGNLNINNTQLSVSESELKYNFLLGVEVPDPEYNTTVLIKSLSALKSERCNPNLVWNLK